MFNYQRLQIALYVCHSNRFLEYFSHLIKLTRFLYLYKSKIKVVHKNVSQGCNYVRQEGLN
jgi:hypothetical protein